MLYRDSRAATQHQCIHLIPSHSTIQLPLLCYCPLASYQQGHFINTLIAHPDPVPQLYLFRHRNVLTRLPAINTSSRHAQRTAPCLRLLCRLYLLSAATYTFTLLPLPLSQRILLNRVLCASPSECLCLIARDDIIPSLLSLSLTA